LTVAPIFVEWIERNVPGKTDKVLNRLRRIRGGRLNDPRFGTRMSGEGIVAEQILRMFHVARRKEGFHEGGPEFSTAASRKPGGAQLALGL
jgi:hypothetical protein